MPEVEEVHSRGMWVDLGEVFYQAYRKSTVGAGLCGSWLACDASTSVHQLHRGDAIAAWVSTQLSSGYVYISIAAVTAAIGSALTAGHF